MKIDIRPTDENGNGHGYWEVYWDNGQLWFKGTYIHGKEYGYWEEYWKNGQLYFTGHYIDGVRYGLFERYYYNGVLEHRRYHYIYQAIYITSNNKLIL